MKTKFFVVAFLLAAISPLSHAGFYDGNKLIQWEEGFKRAKEGKARDTTDYQNAASLITYVIATADSMEGFLCANNATGNQVVAVVLKYLDAHPEEWSKPASSLVSKALLESFRCNRK